MIKTHSDDPDVRAAAAEADNVIANVLSKLSKADDFDYGGHDLRLGEYGVCIQCTRPIAEAQAARDALLQAAQKTENDTVREHIELAAHLFDLEAQAAEVRAELHNGQGSEQILNRILGFIYDRGIADTYDHSHHGGSN